MIACWKSPGGYVKLEDTAVNVIISYDPTVVLNVLSLLRLLFQFGASLSRNKATRPPFTNVMITGETHFYSRSGHFIFQYVSARPPFIFYELSNTVQRIFICSAERIVH
jgi:hypothetical protein